MSILSLLLFVAGSEGALRLFHVQDPYERPDIFLGFEGSPPLFYRTRSRGEEVFRTSPNRLEFFNAQEFPARKPRGGLRIFAFGGSTTYGEPWGHRGSFAHFLESAIARGDPGRPVQVVNAGGKGYGSTAIVSLATEALGYDPDLFVLSIGQNEYREALFHPEERAGRSSVPRWRAFLARHSRIHAVLERAIAGARPERRGARPTSFAAREIAGILAHPFDPGSFRFPGRLAIPPIAPTEDGEDPVLSRFGENLRAILRLAADAGVPCLVLTQVRNEQYWLAPNRSTLRPGAEAEYEPRYRRLLEAARAGRIDEALARVDSVTALYDRDRDAYLHALEGDLRLAAGRTAEARRAFARAWGDDPVNAVIRDAAREQHALLLEAEPPCRAAAPESLLGFGVFYDEVHPEPLLHRAIGEAARRALADAGLLPPETAPAGETPLPDGPDAEVFSYEALRALYLGEWGRAEAFAESALAVDPALGKAHVYRGICAARRGDLETARRDWEALARLYPSLLPAEDGRR